MTPMCPRPHDLLRVSGARECFDFEGDADAALEYVKRDALVVVRRVVGSDGRIAIGVRGDTRAQRYAGWVSVDAVVERIRPTDVLHVVATRSCPAFVALALLKERWRDVGYVWGPTGSVGFEFASGRPTVQAGSDLDILIRMDEPITPADAMVLLKDTGDLPCTVDVQVETSVGEFALEEFARGEGPVLLKTESGPLLTRDPWRPQVWT